ncbi:MAG: FxsA family protein [Rhodobiaceae bacterium]|nr:FxsA family protein [Rhodobiaceae bacterium]
MIPLVIFILFLSIPIIEIGLFISVGGMIGLWPTLAIVILTAILGTALLRRQGLSVLRQAQADLDAGRVPLARIADGLFLLVAAVLLLTPGFMTDTLGFLLFIPAVRQTIGRAVLAWFARNGRVTVATAHAGRRDYGRYGDTTVIEGEAVEISTDDDRSR